MRGGGKERENKEEIESRGECRRGEIKGKNRYKCFIIFERDKYVQF